MYRDKRSRKWHFLVVFKDYNIYITASNGACQPLGARKLHESAEVRLGGDQFYQLPSLARIYVSDQFYQYFICPLSLWLSFLLRVEPTRPPRPIRAHPTTESESSTPLVVPAPEGVETSVFPYPYIAAGSLAALLLLLLLCLLLLLLLRRCRRRRRSEPGKFDAEAFANALYDKGGLPPPAYVVADIDEVPDYFISQNVNRFNSLNAYRSPISSLSTFFSLVL